MATLTVPPRSQSSEAHRHDIEELNGLLLGEVSAVETYQLAIGKFEGVEEALARMGGNLYLMDAARVITAAALIMTSVVGYLRSPSAAVEPGSLAQLACWVLVNTIFRRPCPVRAAAGAALSIENRSRRAANKPVAIWKVPLRRCGEKGLTAVRWLLRLDFMGVAPFLVGGR
jgi:hypothetical protein